MGQDGESRSEAYRMGQKHFRVYGVKLSEAVYSSEPCRARSPRVGIQWARRRGADHRSGNWDCVEQGTT